MNDLYDDINAIETDCVEISDLEIRQKAINLFGQERVRQMSVDEMLQEIN